MSRPNSLDRQVHGQIARRIRRARHEKGWTQEQLAEAVDVATETISRYESGRRALSLTMIHKLAGVLSIRVELLVGKKPAGLTRAEAELIEGWRLLDSEGQRLVMELVRWGGRGTYRPRPVAKSASVQDPSSHAPQK